MIDINELRRKVNSTDAVDHIDLHTNIKPTLSELLDRFERRGRRRLAQARLNGMGSEREAALLEAAEKAVTEAYQRGYATGQEEIEKELAELRSSMKFRTSLIGRTEAERDALSAELSKQQSLTDAAQHIAEVAQSRANRLRAKIAEMERQEPVAEWVVGRVAYFALGVVTTLAVVFNVL